VPFGGSGCEGGVTGGSVNCGPGPSVRRLEVAMRPAPRQRGLQGVVMRVGVVSKQLVAGIAVEAWSRSAGDGVGKSVSGNRQHSSVGEPNVDGIYRRRIQRLNSVARFAQVDRVRSDVADLEHPALAQ